MFLKDSEILYNEMKKENPKLPEFSDYLINLGNGIKENCCFSSQVWIWADITGIVLTNK